MASRIENIENRIRNLKINKGDEAFFIRNVKDSKIINHAVQSPSAKLLKYSFHKGQRVIYQGYFMVRKDEYLVRLDYDQFSYYCHSEVLGHIDSISTLRSKKIDKLFY